jgi:hypothetical protein
MLSPTFTGYRFGDLVSIDIPIASSMTVVNPDKPIHAAVWLMRNIFDRPPGIVGLFEPGIVKYAWGYPFHASFWAIFVKTCSSEIPPVQTSLQTLSLLSYPRRRHTLGSYL